MNRQEILGYATELSKAYARTKARISIIVSDKKMVSVKYAHFAKKLLKIQ